MLFKKPWVPTPGPGRSTCRTLRPKKPYRRLQSKGARTRERILDLAYDAVIMGFSATSIEELVTEAGVTKSGFSCREHRDKNDLAHQMLGFAYQAENDVVSTDLDHG